MELPPAEQPYSGSYSGSYLGPFAYVVARASSPSVRLALGLGALYGLIGGLFGALQVLGAALAVALNQEAIARYQTQYVAYQACQRTSATPALCQPPTAGVLAVNSIWLIFLLAGLLAFALSQLAYARAARSAAGRTSSRTTGLMAALIAAVFGWLLYLGASVVSVLAQASPFTMTAPPLGVEADTLHLGAAIGYAIVDSLALLPTLTVAALVGLVGAARGKRQAGPSSYVVVSYGPPMPSGAPSLTATTAETSIATPIVTPIAVQAERGEPPAALKPTPVRLDRPAGA